jgi:hypothetical protein
MNYLTGPLTRVQLPELNALVGAGDPSPGREVSKSHEPKGSTRQKSGEQTSSTRPNVPAGIDEFYLPNNLSLQEAVDAAGISAPQDVQYQVIYKPVLLAQAAIRFLKRNYNLDYDLISTALVREPDRQGRIRWDDWVSKPLDLDSLERQARPEARFQELAAPLTDGAKLREFEADYQDWIYHEITVSVRANEELEVYAGPQISQGDFRRSCAEAAEEKLKADKEKVNETYDKKMDTISDRLLREERELEEDKVEHSQRKMEEAGTHAENLLSLLAGRRRSMSTSLTKRRMTSKAKADVEESLDMIDQYKNEIEELVKERENKLEEAEEKWQDILEEVIEIPVTPYKKDILMELYGIAWLPYYSYQDGSKQVELAAFST